MWGGEWPQPTEAAPIFLGHYRTRVQKLLSGLGDYLGVAPVAAPFPLSPWTPG